MNELVIDGCNAMHRLRLSGSPGAARKRLVDAVRAAAPRGVTVWFDGHAGAGSMGGTDDQGVALRFSGGTEADDAIVEQVRASRHPRRIVVVTDDLELARRVEQLGAASLRVAAFFAETASPEEKPSTGGGGWSAADFGLPSEIDLARPPASLGVPPAQPRPPRAAPSRRPRPTK